MDLQVDSQTNPFTLALNHPPIRTSIYKILTNCLNVITSVCYWFYLLHLYLLLLLLFLFILDIP